MNYKKVMPNGRQGLTHQNFLKKISGGFTLLELLVVVAIIGIVVTVVLASLSDARKKGGDAGIKKQLNSMRSQAELYKGTGTAFAVGTCSVTAAAVAGTLFDNATGTYGLENLLRGGGIILANTRCASASGLPSSGSNWAVAVKTSTGAWCVGSSGVARNKTAGGTLYTWTGTPVGVGVIAAGGTTCL